MNRWILIAMMGAAAACGPKPRPATPDVPSGPAAPTGDGAGSAAEPAARTPDTSFELDGNAVVLPGPVTFATDSAELTADADPALWHVFDYLAAKDAITLLRIEVHTSSDTPDAQALTEARARTVAAWLIAHGVACDRLIAVGFGDTKPVADGSTPDGRAANRRVEFQNAMLRGHAIGGMPTDGGGQVAGDLCAH